MALLDPNGSVGPPSRRPVTFAVLTTVAAFSPLLFVPGMMGKVLRVIPLVVIPCLLFSLLESLNILPAHLSHIPRRVRRGPWRRLQSRFANGPKRFAQRVYCPCSTPRSAGATSRPRPAPAS